jgi:hypothetical protein
MLKEAKPRSILYVHPSPRGRKFENIIIALSSETSTTRRIQYWYQTDTCASRIGLEQNTWFDIYWNQRAYLVSSLVTERRIIRTSCVVKLVKVA